MVPAGGAPRWQFAPSHPLLAIGQGTQFTMLSIHDAYEEIRVNTVYVSQSPLPQLTIPTSCAGLPWVTSGPPGTSRPTR